jgi:hypothetical protein
MCVTYYIVLLINTLTDLSYTAWKLRRKSTNKSPRVRQTQRHNQKRGLKTLLNFEDLTRFSESEVSEGLQGESSLFNPGLTLAHNNARNWS